MLASRFRTLALSLPDAAEGAHMRHPDFRAHGRIFATLNADETWAMVKVTPAQQAALVALDPEVYVPAAGAWGRQGCTQVLLNRARVAIVRQALVDAYERAARDGAPRR